MLGRLAFCLNTNIFIRQMSETEIQKVTFNQRLIKYEAWLHVVFWTATFFYPYLKFMSAGQEYPNTAGHDLVELIFDAIPAYILYCWFFPLKNKKRYLFLIPVILVLNTLLYMYSDSFFHRENPYPLEWKTIYVVIERIVNYTTFAIVFFALFSIKQLYKKQQEIKAIARKEQQAQLRLLKRQLNPHFLFNTLNTIYASALEKKDKTPDLILKLSDSFRYVLHEGQKSSVTLEKEISHLKDYINLQKERLTDKVEVLWQENIDNYEQLIPPLLLISFVENAFKYSSMLAGENHTIKIKIGLADKNFSFYCENFFRDQVHEEMDANWKESGIGIQNTRRRLELLFPDRHTIEIDTDDHLFRVKLQVKL